MEVEKLFFALHLSTPKLFLERGNQKPHLKYAMKNVMYGMVVRQLFLSVSGLYVSRSLSLASL